MLPSGALDFLAKTRPEGSNMFTPDYMGAYLNWHSPGRARPFLDARMDAWSTALLRDHTVAILDRETTSRQEILDRRKVEALLLDYPGALGALGVEPGLRRSAFDPQGPWALVWWDDSAMLYLRRPLAQQLNLRALDQINPADPAPRIDQLVAAAAQTTIPLQTPEFNALADEFRHIMQISPDSVFAARLQGYLLARGNHFAEASRAWREVVTRSDRRGIRLQPGDAEALVGTLRDAGLIKEAEDAAQEMARR
jgi:hypothetical protein